MSAPLRLLLAPDKFKGSLTALEAANALSCGLGSSLAGSEIRLAPIADGGEGTCEALRASLGGEWITLPTTGPLGERIEARYLWIDPATAVIEMSEASGMWRVPPGARDPLRASTRGTGEMIRHAAARGAKQILVGLGGSATNDAGAGLAAALGWEFLTSDGEPIEPIPANFLALERIHPPEDDTLPEIIALCDVRNPLLGPRGASRTYGPQKGADPRTVETLEAGLENLADIAAATLERDHRDTPGAGAAGGLGFGLLTFCQAEIRSGFDEIARVSGLEEAIAWADIIVTGEGRIDAQTLEGKGPAGIAALARRHGKPVIAFAGSIGDEEQVGESFDMICPLADRPMTLDESLRDAALLLERAAARTGRLLRIGQLL